MKSQTSEHEAEMLNIVPRRLVLFRRVRKISKSDYYLRNDLLSVCLSAWKNSTSTWPIFMKFDIWRFFENLSRKFKLDYNPTGITGILQEYICTFIISTWITLRITNVSDKSVEKIKTHISCSINYSEYRVVYKILWKNIVERGHIWQYNTAQKRCPLYAG
jgi:hypothetical protein